MNPNDTNIIDLPEEFDKLSTLEREQLLEWCLLLGKIQTFNTDYTSYGLKHLFENSSDGFYISNGAFKGAMIKAGFRYKEATPVKNWYFNVSKKSVKLEEKQQRL